jgi:FkbM family methyltransferase
LYALAYAASKLPSNVLIFDVGANTGQFAFSAARIFSDKTIYCFEPAQKTFTELNKLITENKYQQSIKSFLFGFGEKQETRILYSSGEYSPVASLHQIHQPHEEFKEEYTEKVSIDTIDFFCVKNEIKRIDYLKLDIEGHEYKALLGAKRMLAEKRITFIQFEFGECNIDSRTFFRDFYNLLNDNYNFYRIVSNGITRINEYTTDLETFATINYLAEMKH